MDTVAVSSDGSPVGRAIRLKPPGVAGSLVGVGVVTPRETKEADAATGVPAITRHHVASEGVRRVMA